MNREQIAFFNYQLAGMLRTGIPLESALRELCRGLRRGRWRQEMEQLEQDLAQGVPLAQALERRRQLPQVYVQLLRVGAGTQDLPATLTMAADYYADHHQFWMRFRAVMLYPVMVLALALVVCLMLVVTHRIGQELFVEVSLGVFPGAPAPMGTPGLIWFGPVLLSILLVGASVVSLVPRLRVAARWHLPGWKEGTLAQAAASLSLLLRGGVGLPQALKLLAELEPYERARKEFRNWEARLAQGQTRFEELALGTRLFPPLFVWLVAGAGEDLPAGFERATQLYRARARHRMDLMLFALMPAAVIVLGVVILGQLIPMMRSLSSLFEAMGGGI